MRARGANGLTCLPVRVRRSAGQIRSEFKKIECRNELEMVILSSQRYFIVANAGSWCSGLTCLPVTEEIAGSNPVGPAKQNHSLLWWVFLF